MFRKASNIYLLGRTRYTMVASRRIEIPYYRSTGQQRGRGIGALALVIDRTAIPFLRKYVVPAAKRAGTELIDFASPEVLQVLSGRKNLTTRQRAWEDQ